MKRKTLILTLVAIGMAVVATSAAFDMGWENWSIPSTLTSVKGSALSGLSGLNGSSQVAQLANTDTDPIVPGVAPNYRAIVQKNGPAVVGITSIGLHVLDPGTIALYQDSRFAAAGGIPFREQGSGFIISPDGIILTNAHVVLEAREVVVKLSDRREFKARVLGVDHVTDVAVLRIEANSLPVVRLGDTRQLQVGDPVLAIGSPFGLEQTATQGIVSAMGRSLPGDSSVAFIQTDAAVNPGNSGGPLFDSQGAVVGINAQIYSQSGGYQGLSFAIPVNVALRIKNEIISKGYASHARLGVLLQELSQPLAEAFGLSRPGGALVLSVVNDTPASAGRLLPGDIIIEVNGEKLARAAELSSRISLASPGDKLDLNVWRNRSLHAVEITLGRSVEKERAPVTQKAEPTPVQLGLTLRPLSKEERALLRLPGGLLVEKVEMAAARAGLRAGDLLLNMNGRALDSVEQVSGILRRKPDIVALLVQRGAERNFIAVELR